MKIKAIEVDITDDYEKEIEQFRQFIKFKANDMIDDLLNIKGNGVNDAEKAKRIFIRFADYFAVKGFEIGFEVSMKKMSNSIDEFVKNEKNT